MGRGLLIFWETSSGEMSRDIPHISFELESYFADQSFGSAQLGSRCNSRRVPIRMLQGGRARASIEPSAFSSPPEKSRAWELSIEKCQLLHFVFGAGEAGFIYNSLPALWAKLKPSCLSHLIMFCAEPSCQMVSRIPTEGINEGHALGQ